MGEIVTGIIVKGLGLLGVGTATATALSGLIASTALSAVSAALGRRRGGAEMARELEQARSLQPYRHAYGRDVLIAGSPAPGWVTSGRWLMTCHILNSRPSAGGSIRIELDNRDVSVAGDLFDFGTVLTGQATVLEGETEVVIPRPPGADPAGFGTAGPTFAARWGSVPVQVDVLGPDDLTLIIPEPAPEGGAVIDWTAIQVSGGASATNDPFTGHAKFWIGLGDQTHPPTEILRQFGSLVTLDTRRFWPTDAWGGRTVVWSMLNQGEPDDRGRRWPSWPPQLRVAMDWTRVWDPRDEEQDPDDPDTWAVSDNQALCLLDAVRFNPFAPHPLAQIRVDTFEHGADVADEPVGVLAGGTEPRYRVGGLVVYGEGAELSDLLADLESAGAGQLIKVGGQVAYRSGEWREPVVTVTDYSRSGGMRFETRAGERDMPGAIAAVIPDRDAQWEPLQLAPRRVRDDWSGSADRVQTINLPLVPFHAQAQRLIKIRAEQLKARRRLSFVATSEMIEAVAGGVVTVVWGVPRIDGDYMVETMHPARFLDDDGAMFLESEVVLVGTGPQVWAWSHEVDEYAPFRQTFQPFEVNAPAPTDLTAFIAPWSSEVSASAQAPGDYSDPDLWVPNEFLVSVQIEAQVNQAPWGATTTVRLADIPTTLSLSGAPGEVRAVLAPRATGSSFVARARSVMTIGVSPWVYSAPFQDGFSLGDPTGVSATGGAGEIEIDATSPGDGSFHAIQFWGGDTADPFASDLLSEQAGSPSSAFSFTETGLGAGVTRHYHVRAVTSTGAVGPWAAPVSATTT